MAACQEGKQSSTLGCDAHNRRSPQPTLGSLPADVPADGPLCKFAKHMDHTFFTKVKSRQFSDCLTATLLMYLDDTLAVASDHVIHDELTKAAAHHGSTLADLRQWGREIKKRFTMDNLNTLPIDIVKKNLPQNELAHHVIAMSTETLERCTAGYQELLRRSQVLEGLLQRLIDRQDELAAHLGRIENLIASSAYKAGANTSRPHAVPLQLGRPWPSDFKTVAKMSLQNLVYRYIRDDLYSVVFDPNNRFQREVKNAIAIVASFADLTSARIRPEEEHFTERQLEAISDKRIAFVRLIQNRIVDFITQHRANGGTRKRKRSDTHSSSTNKAKRNRSITGLVTGVVKAWGELDENVRNTVASTRRIVFDHAEFGLT